MKRNLRENWEIAGISSKSGRPASVRFCIRKAKIQNLTDVQQKTPATRGTRRGRLRESAIYAEDCVVFNLAVLNEEDEPGEAAGGTEDDEGFHR